MTANMPSIFHIHMFPFYFHLKQNLKALNNHIVSSQLTSLQQLSMAVKQTHYAKLRTRKLSGTLKKIKIKKWHDAYQRFHQTSKLIKYLKKPRRSLSRRPLQGGLQVKQA